MGTMKNIAIQEMETPIMDFCPECLGDGYIIYEVPRLQGPSRDIGYLDEVQEDCKTCSGEGKVKRTCECGEPITIGMGKTAVFCEECSFDYREA